MARITTVTGDIAPEELGFTTMHEHTIADLTLLYEQIKDSIPPIPKEMLALTIENLGFLRSGVSIFSKECSTLGEVDYMVNELKAFKKIGGKTVVDASPIGIRGNANDLKNASEKSGVHIVCATGLYKAHARPEKFIGKSEEYLVSYFEREIYEGIDGTSVKPGFLKCALDTVTDEGKVHEYELTTLRACAKVAAKTGMSLHVHNNRPITNEQMLEAVDIVLNECGVKPDKLLMLHMDSILRNPYKIIDYVSDIDTVRTIDLDLQIKLLEMGVNISFDTWGTRVSILPDDYDRIKGLVELLKKGYASQIVLGHDLTDKSQGVSYGASGFNHFAQFVAPMLKQLNFGNEVFEKLTVENPARILAY